MDIVLNVGEAIPGAPLGILGGFIGQKLRQYVEPERAGTPKGTPIGLSRKKFHAALLALTNIDLRKQAKVIRVSYGVLRKWRTETKFWDCAEALTKEFLDGPFEEACQMSLLQYCKDPDMTVQAKDGIDLNAVGDKERLLGFEDASLYSLHILDIVNDRFCSDIVEVGKTGTMVFSCLRLFLPLRKISRQLEGDVYAKKFARAHAKLLAGLLRNLLLLPTKDRDYQIEGAVTITELIRDVLSE